MFIIFLKFSRQCLFRVAPNARLALPSPHSEAAVTILVIDRLVSQPIVIRVFVGASSSAFKVPFKELSTLSLYQVPLAEPYNIIFDQHCATTFNRRLP